MGIGDTQFDHRMQAASRQLAARRAVPRMRASYESGEYAQALSLCGEILAAIADQFDALHVLGMLHFQQGRLQEAEEFIRRSLKADGQQAWAWANHGMVLLRLERFGAAIERFDRSLRLDARCVPALTGRANALLELQRYDQARIAYDLVLAAAPQQATSWANRGKALLMQKRPADALMSLDRALQLDPHAYATHVNRGHALRALGRHVEALDSYGHALASRPQSAQVMFSQAVTLQDLGHDAQALDLYDAALAINPGYIDALCGVSVALERLQRYDEALARCDRVLALAPTEMRVWLSKGNALQGLMRYQDATLAYDEALRLDGNFADAWSNRAAALMHLRRYAEALDSYDRSLALAGDRVDVLCARGNVLQQLGRYDDASASYRAALAAEPYGVPAWFHRGTALQQVGQHNEALACYEHVIRIAPTHGAARAAEAFCRLLVGDFEQGWRHHESRWADPTVAQSRRVFSEPLWLGEEPLDGRTILLHAEQGFGDTLQFCRYVKVLHEAGARVVLDVQQPLSEVMTTLKGVDTLISTGDAIPPFDLHCPLMSLPLACRTHELVSPEPTSYLRVDDVLAREWSERLSAERESSKLRVGLAWSGNPKHSNDHNRSLTLDVLASLFTLDVHFVSLQPYLRDADRAALATTHLTHFGDALRSFADTAALIESLDLVISVDTSVAHLAGALGRRVWILLPFVPDWRWLLDREDSPWYPSARLFRQPVAGDWASVIAQVLTALQHEFAPDTEV